MVRRSNPGDTAKQKQLGFVHAFVHERKVPPVLTRKIRGFFAGNYTQHGTVFDERKFFDKMPQDLREELGLHLQYIDHGGGGKRNGILWKVPFFETLGHTDMIRICCQLKYLRVQPPEFDENGRPDHSHYIMKQGEHTNDMSACCTAFSLRGILSAHAHATAHTIIDSARVHDRVYERALSRFVIIEGMHLPLPVVGISIGMERARQQMTVSPTARFVIIEGMVRVERNRKPLGKLRQYDYFGEN